jgi:glutaredoxin
MDNRVKIYGADWCGDTVRALRHLKNKGITFDYVDIEEDREGEAKVIAFNNGKRRIPLVEIATEDGQTTSLSVPSARELDEVLGK